ncbi:MAG: PAS domain S-box protein [bacterium]|nr:PAS domain S-box protein [bacterium]
MGNNTTSHDAADQHRYSIWLAKTAGFFAVAGGLATLIGWMAGLQRLKDWEGNGTTMKANAALAVVLLGIALLLIVHFSEKPKVRIAAQLLAVFAALLGTITLIEHIANIDLGIDTFLALAPANERATASPGRMGPPAAISFLLLGAAIFSLTLSRFRRFASSLAVCTAAIALLSLIGYLYGAEPFYDLPRLTGIALQTAIMILALSIGIVLSTPEREPLKTLVSGTSAGLLLRRFLPVILIVPIGLGLVGVVGQVNGLYDAAAGTAALVILLIAMLSGVLVQAATAVSRNENSLRESQHRLATTLASIGDGVITTSSTGVVAHLNPVAESLTGWKSSAAVGRPIEEVFSIVNETTREAVESPVSRAIRSRSVVELENHTLLIRPDGTEIAILDSAAPIFADDGDIEGAVLIFHDYSSRRETQRKLERSEYELRDFFENATVGIHWVGEDGTILRVNQHELDMVGYAREEYVGRNIGHFHADAPVIDKILQALTSGESLHEYPARLICKDGSIKNVLISSNVFREDGKFVHTRCFTRDVTEFLIAQEAKAHLAAIVQASVDAIVSKTLDGTITTWNEGAQHIFGYAAEQAIGQNIRMLIPADRLDEEQIIIERLKIGERIRTYDTVRLRSDGTSIDVSLTISPIRDASGQIVGASKFARDITDRKTAERAVLDSEERLRLALDAGKMGTWEWRITENEVLWSPGLEKIHGLQPGAFDGTFEAFKNDVHPEDREHVLETIAKTVQEGLDHHVEYRLLLSDGTVRWVEGRGKLFQNPDGETARLIGVCADITNRREAEEQLRENEKQVVRNAEVFRRLVEQSPFGIYTVDSAFRVHQISVGAQAVFRNVNPLIGRDFAEVMRMIWPEPLASDLIEIFRNTLATGESYLAPSLTAPRGDIDEVESYEWQLHRVTLPDGQFGVVCYFFDSTRLKQTEDELRMVAANLSEADRRKNEFLAMLAHELRNPLAPIRNALQIMRLTNGHGDQAALDMMERQLNQLVRLVDDLLDISRISTGKIELRKDRIELSSFIRHAVEAVRPTCENLGIELKVELPKESIFMEGDPARLAQVIGNLLNNSAKFTDPGGAISLFVAREGGQAAITVRDDGIGIAPDEIGVIFDMFVQADTSIKRSSSGLGIGLTLVKNLVEMHGGTVTAASGGLGRGTEFVVRLPILAETDTGRPSGREKSKDKNNSTARRVLVVDDNVDSASSMEMLLRIIGHDVRMAHDGLAAVERAREFLPEVILLDIGLPGLNGYEAARRIKESDWGKPIVLIALTGWGQEEDRQRSREAGFARHLVKPIEHDELIKILEELAPSTNS